MNTPIDFYEREFYPLSNFSSFQLYWKKKLYPTSEHAYHSEKFLTKDLKNSILDCRSAHECYKEAKHWEAEGYLRPDWYEVRVAVMEEILEAKVAQHPYVKKKLLETGTRELIEGSWRDDFWGTGPNGDGRNELGKAWMRVREKLCSS